MAELQDGSGYSDATRNKKLSALNMLLRRAEEYGALPVRPRTIRYKESQHRIRWFSDLEEQDMLRLSKHIGLHDFHVLILVGLDTGFRRSELLRVYLKDYSKGNLMAHEGETKNGAARSIPAMVRVQATVAAQQAAGGSTKLFPTLSVATQRKQCDDLRSFMGKGDDAGFIPHVMRHTCATRLVTEGVPLNEVQAWMGHEVIQTMMRYAHLMPDALKGAAARIAARTPELEPS